VLGKHTLKAGEKTTLKITYDTAGRPGAFRKNIDIATDIPGQKEIELVMSGTVKEAPGAKIQVVPRKADIGLIPLNSSKAQSLTVTNVGTLPLVIRKIASKDGAQVYFEGAGGGDFVVEAGKSRPINLDIRVTKPGPFTEVIALDSNAKNAPKGGFAIMISGRHGE
jgi:hypothetical protein